jgi:zinc protease
MLPLVVAVLGTASAAHAAVDVRTTSVGGGVKAWYVTNEAVPVVDIRISFEGAGSASDPEGKGGRAAFAASMITEGAGTLDSVAFRRALDERAITLDVSTSDDRLDIHIYCLREHATRAGQLLALALAEPQLAEADQTRMKATLSSIINRYEERPGYRARRLINGRLFTGHPYANPPYGTVASLNGLGAQDVRDFMKTYLTRGNVTISAAGDVDASLLDDVLRGVVAALPENDSGAVAVTVASLQGAGETLRATMDVPQTTILFAAPGIARDDPRFYAAYLLNHILGGGTLYSRLGDEVRQKKGLVYAIDSDLIQLRGAALIGGSLATRNASTDAAIAETKSVLSAIHAHGVTSDECKDAKSYVDGAFARQLDSSGSITGVLQMMQVHNLGKDYLSERAGLFAKVSCSDINAVAESLLDPSRFLFAVVGGDAVQDGASVSTPSDAPRNDTH